MATPICPHCGYDPAAGRVIGGAAKGAAVGAVTLLNPILGAVALTGLALAAWIRSGKTEIKCFNCGKYYHS